ncbi:rubrerythrin family protein [Candidatus Saccharibacteria bacterium]|nr:rubrerythrin family protein [Candidatus Saccharibacteria bacterium]
MAEFKESKTYKNLQKAFAGEAQAYTKYMFYASKARKDGYEQMGALFEETAENEKEHAKIWFKMLHDSAVPDTTDNLEDAIAGENYETNEMYKQFTKVAREEGFEEIAQKFEGVGGIERAHEERYRKLLKNIDDDIVFKSDKVTVWKCRNCGYIFTGDKAPEVCPVCSHPQSFFEIRAVNY